MLKRIQFDISLDIAQSNTVRALLQALEQNGIDCFLSSALPSSIVCDNEFSQSPKDCLVLTDSAAGIASARATGIPCIGYTPQERSEDMSGAYALFEDFASIDVAYLRRTHAHAIGYPADILTTERLTVREFSDKDFPTLYAMCTEPSTASFMEEVLSDYETEQEKHTAYIRNVYPIFDLALWGVYEKDSGNLIGRAGFSLPEDGSDTFSIGYLIDVPYRRCGYAKELIPALLSYAKEQGYTEISASIKQENVASVKALEQCGFPYERRDNNSEAMITYVIHLTV